MATATLNRRGGTANRVDPRGWRVVNRYGKPVEILKNIAGTDTVENNFTNFRDALAHIMRCGKLGEWFAVSG